MDVTQYLHPLMQRGMTKDPNSVYNALINALNSPLNNAESDILRSKTNIMLAQAPEDWLDTFGSWLGLKRKDKEPDNVYRKRLMDWVLTDKNDVSSIRNAIANFLNISSDCVYVYEPYTDMLYYNKLGSDYNSLKYFASSYYNYCVIDVQIDNTFPIREIQDIINLFRPAGVIYVLTMNINSFNHNAPIIDMSEDGSTPMFYDETYYAGFNQRVQALITPGLSDDITVTNPFFWSTSLSELNEGREYQNEDSQFNDYMVLGEYYNDYDPRDTDTFTDGRVYAKNYSLQDRNLMAKRDNDCLKFNIGKFDSDYQPLSFTTTLNQGSSYNNNVYSVNSNSKGITFTFSNLDPNFTYILFYHTITGSLDIESEDPAVVNGDLNMEYKIVYPGGDNGNITFTSIKGISSFNNVSLIKLNSGDKTTTTYNYNTSIETAYGLGGVANVMGALQMHFSLPSNINKNNLLTDYYSESYLTIRMKADIPIKSTHNIDIYIYDFSANVWSLFRTTSVDDNSYIEQNIKINDYSNILNSEGCLFYRIVSDIDIDVDYFGLSFNDYIYNDPNINSYFNSSKLVLKNTFTDGRLGDWEMKTVVNDNTCPIESLKDVASESLNNSTVFYNLRRCVIPGTIYKIDAEIYSTSGVTFGVSKNNDSIHDGGTIISTSDGGWQHISGYIQIKNGIFSIYPYFMINSNDGILKISYINAEITDKNTIENNMIISSNNGYNNMMYTLSSLKSNNS